MLRIDFHLLEEPLKTLPGLRILNRPPIGGDGRFAGPRFFTVMYNGQYFCIEQEKETVVVKTYLRHSPFTKQRAADTEVITENSEEITDLDIQRILTVIRDAPRYARPREGDPIQQIYGGTGLHPLTGYYMQLSKVFLDSLSERELYILNELDYIENPITTMTEKILVFTGRDGQFFKYDLSEMRVMDLPDSLIVDD